MDASSQKNTPSEGLGRLGIPAIDGSAEEAGRDMDTLDAWLALSEETTPNDQQEPGSEA